MQIGLILIALAFPLLELAVLIKTGQIIGFWRTLLVLVVAAVVGGLIIRRQGLAAAQRAMLAMREGRPPIEPVADSMLLMLAGTLLLIPGLITDAVGLLLLVPPLRRAFARKTLSKLFAGVDIRTQSRTWDNDQPRQGTRPGGPRQAPDGGVVIDGEWERVDEPKPSAPKSTSPETGPAKTGGDPIKP